MKTVADVVRGREIYTIQRRQTIYRAARFMADKKVGAVCVLEDDKLVGVLSERDLMTRVVAQGRDSQRTEVDEVMTRELVVADAGDSWDVALRKMKSIGVRHLPVVEGGKLIGMISLRDLLLSQIEVREEEVKWLEKTVALCANSPKFLTWRCLGCGHVLTASDPPKACPVCGRAKEEFVNVEED